MAKFIPRKLLRSPVVLGHVWFSFHSDRAVVVRRITSTHVSVANVRTGQRSTNRRSEFAEADDIPDRGFIWEAQSVEDYRRYHDEGVPVPIPEAWLEPSPKA